MSQSYHIIPLVPENSVWHLGRIFFLQITGMLFNKLPLQCAKWCPNGLKEKTCFQSFNLHCRNVFIHRTSADLMYHILKCQQIYTRIIDGKWKLQKMTFFFFYSFPNIRSPVHQCMILQRRHFITAQGTWCWHCNLIDLLRIYYMIWLRISLISSGVVT